MEAHVSLGGCFSSQIMFKGPVSGCQTVNILLLSKQVTTIEPVIGRSTQEAESVANKLFCHLTV